MQIKIDNNQIITGMTREQKEAVKSALTYDNPKYNQAKRYGRSRYISIPPYLTYYVDHGSDSLEVPFGFDLFSLPEIKNSSYKVETLYKEVYADFPEITISLREDQEKAFNAFLHYQRPHSMQDNNYGIIQLPTGKGKTILGLYMAYYLKQKTLILVHKDDLVVGWKKDIDKCFGGKCNVGLIKAKSRTVGAQFTIATVQTLSKMNEKELSEFTHRFGMVICDECHHIASTTFNIIDRFSCYYKVGLSATPTRTDKLTQCFDLFLGGIVYKHKYSKDDKDILPVEVRVTESRARFRPFVVANSNGVYAVDQFFNMYDYKPEELPSNYKPVDMFYYKDRPRVPNAITDNYVVLDRRFKIQVCKQIISEVRQGHSCLALFTQKDHIRQYYSYLCRFLPKNIISLYYGDSKESSEDIMKKAESRETLITLGTLAKTTEGTNVKAWEVLFLVSSINNEKNTEQATGRIRRSNKGKINPVIVYDYRHPDVVGIQSHFSTRKAVYDRLEYDVKFLNNRKQEKITKGSLFNRGYK